MQKLEKINVNQHEEEKHLREFFDEIDCVYIVPDIKDFLFSTDEVIDESLYEEYEDVEIYPGENLLYLTDGQLMQIPSEEIHAFTNTELLERIFNLDKGRLLPKQIELLQQYYEKYRALIDRGDIEYLLNRLQNCCWVSAMPRRKNDAFSKFYNLVEKNKFDIISQLKVSDYIENGTNYYIWHFDANIITFRTDSIIIDGNTFKNITTKFKVDLDTIHDLTVVAVSFCETNE